MLDEKHMVRFRAYVATYSGVEFHAKPTKFFRQGRKVDRVLGIGWLGIGQIGVELPVGVPTERNEKIR